MTTDIQTIARGDASRILRAQRVVARGEEEWRALWAAHAGPSGIAPPVDFSARMVAAVFQGQRPSAGFETTIVGARDDDAGKALVVQVDEHPPSAGRSAAHVLVSPFHIVSLARFDGAVRFEDAYRHANEVTQAAPVPERADVTTPTVPAPSMSSSSSCVVFLVFDGAHARSGGSARLPRRAALRRAPPDPGAHEPLGAIPRLASASSGWAGSASGRSSVSAWHSCCCSCRRAASRSCAGWLALPRSPGYCFWVICLVQAFKGRQWKMPVVGDYADRLRGKIASSFQLPARSFQLPASSSHQLRAPSAERRAPSAERRALPPVALAQRGHMRRVVTAVPGIELQQPVVGDDPALGVHQLPPKVLLLHRLQQHDPPAVQCVEQRQ